MIALSLFFIPLIIGVLALNSKSSAMKSVATLTPWVMVILSVAAWIRVAYHQVDAFSMSLIPQVGFEMSLILNGPTTAMVLLTSIAGAVITLLASSRTLKNPSRYLGWILIMLSAMSGAFMAQDALWFYICYELALIPIFFLLLSWGKAEHLHRVAMRFFLYTLFGSLFMLISLLYVHGTMAVPSFDLDDMWAAGQALSSKEQAWVFSGLFLAFAVKMPVFPFHSWQPVTYDSAPLDGTMLLAAIMLKMATFGLIRLALPMAPAGIGSWAIALSVIGIVYASLVALAQKRFKLLIAYSSMAHVGMISAGVLANNAQGITGGIFEMFSHGILAVGLFLAYDIIEKRMGHDRMSDMGGIRTSNPLFAFLFFIIVMGSVALPFTSGFVGEFLLIQGLAKHSLLVAGIAGLTVILGAAYMLRAFQSMMLGEANPTFASLNNLEKYSLVLIVLMVVILGVYPSPLLDLIQMNF